MIAPIEVEGKPLGIGALSTKTPALRQGLDERYDFASYLNDSLTFAR
jgi:hypothetical protein